MYFSFLKPAYTQGGLNLVLQNHDKDSAYIKKERKYRKQVTLVSGRRSLELVSWYRTALLQLAYNIDGEASMNWKVFTAIKERGHIRILSIQQNRQISCLHKYDKSVLLNDKL